MRPPRDSSTKGISLEGAAAYRRSVEGQAVHFNKKHGQCHTKYVVREHH